MKFIVIYGKIKGGRQKVGYVHSKNKKKIPLWFVDVVATVKNFQVTSLTFTKKFIKFRGLTKSYCVTFGAAEPSSISAKRNADTKKKLW